MIELMPKLDNTKAEPLYIQLYEYIKKEILNDNIKCGTKLPSKRQLCKHLNLSQTTIKNAYEQLCCEGYTESMPRKGIFVKEIDDNLFTLSSAKNTVSSGMSQSNSNKENSDSVIDFTYGTIDSNSFPYSIWRKFTFQSLFPEDSDILKLGDPQGELNLRNEICDYLFQSRGVKCSANQIILGAGTQILLTLLCMILGRDKTYAFENPGFNKARYVFQDQNVDLACIPLDQYGISIKDLEQSSAKIVYITPSHQFPTGTVMPISRRLELLKWSIEKDGFIIEDDYDSEFRYRGKPIPSLQCLDKTGHVIYMGTFSKSLIPSIRINYMVLPASLLEIYKSNFSSYNQTVSRLHQDTLYKFMSSGYWERHLNKMRTIYKKKHKLLISIINKYMPEKVKIIGESSGLHIILEINNGMSEEELINTARKVNVRVYPTSVYYYKKNTNNIPCIMLGFGALNEQLITKGITLLKDAWNL